MSSPGYLPLLLATTLHHLCTLSYLCIHCILAQSFEIWLMKQQNYLQIYFEFFIVIYAL